MLPCPNYTSREFGHGTFQNSVQSCISPSLLQISQSSFRTRASLGFGFCLHSQSSAKMEHRVLRHTSPTYQNHELVATSNTDFYNLKSARVLRGFKVYCHSKPLILLTKVSSNSCRKKRYGGELPALLRRMESGNDIEVTLNSFGKNLTPKEQTVILKEQRSWKKVIRIFEWFKLQKEYVPNVIHYNIVLRFLGRAQRWDDLRLCWIDMAKSGVFPTNNTYGMLVDVYGKAGLVKEALLWIKHMRLRGIFPDEVTMNTIVRVLKDAGEYDKADKFYKDWCVGQIELHDLDLDSIDDSVRGSDLGSITFMHFLSTELFKTRPRYPITKLTSSDEENSIRKPQFTSTYNTLIDLYGKAGRLKDAADVFGEMLKSGVAMDTITFNTMIFTCGRHGNLSEAETLLAKMEERGISPDTKTYNIFLSLYADVGNIDAALKCYRKIREVGLHPDIVTQRAVLLILCQRNMVQYVETVIEDMERSGIPIDEQSIPGVVKMYVNQGMVNQAKLFFDKCNKDVGISPKISAAVMDAYAEKGMWAEAEAVFFRKRDLIGHERHVVEYNVMVKAYGKAKLYNKAFSLFKSMRNNGTWPDECTYNSLIQMFSGGDLVDHAMDLVIEMRGMGLKTDCQTFSALIACYSRLEQLSEAVDLYQEMIRAGVKPNDYVFGSLINGFAESGKVEEALKYFQQMQKYGISANQIVLTSLIKAYSKVGCLEGAKVLYDKMKDMEGGPDNIASNSMINLYADHGMVSDAELVFEDLREKNLVDEVSFSIMMYLYMSIGMLDKAIDIAEEMKHSGFIRDCASFNKVMACYAANGQLRECCELLHEMITRKLLPDSWTFKVLFTVLKKRGVSNEAVAQLESSYLEGTPYSRQAVIASVYSAVGMHTLAIESCEAIIKADVNLDSSAYNAAIYVYGEAGAIDKALNIFMKMQDQDLEPDVVTCINLVGCYGKAGMLEGVKRIYSQLKYEEIEPNKSLFKAVIDAYKIAKRDDLAELVSQEMKFALDSKPSFCSEAEDEFIGTSKLQSL